MAVAKIKDGWLVCAKCGKKLGKVLGNCDIEIKCRNSKCGCKNIATTKGGKI